MTWALNPASSKSETRTFAIETLADDLQRIWDVIEMARDAN